MGAKSCKVCTKKKKFVPGGSILDRVISQSSNQDQCLLYKLANYKKGGELIDAYNIGGTIEVEKLMREQFGQLMYQDGRGQIINRAEYLRWKFRDHDKVVLPIEASLSPYDPLAQWSDHEACWQMQYRGSLGETLLHVLIICDTKIHTKLARILIKCFPKLALDVVEGEEYLGASSLHLAIAYFNNELVQDLVDAGANVNQRAIGSFFLPRDQQRAKPAKHTDYEGLAYLGEYPLAWAACCANESVYNLLLDVDAHPDLQDRFGNMVLHMVVVCDKLDMFGYALRHPRQPARNGIANVAGLTPLTLSCQLGRADVFKEMLELSAREFWRYSNITCSAYPLNALDTLLPDGRTNYNSALFIILNGTKEEHLDMLDGGIIQRLLEEKWKTFARNQFLKRLLILMVHLILLSLAVYLRPDDPDEPLLGYTTDVVTITRYGCEIGTVLGVLSYVILQQGDEIKNQGLLTFLKQQAHSPAKAIFLVSNLLILACIPFRLMRDRATEEGILLIAVPGSWFLLMFFAGAVRLTGPFVTMIYSMITGDMLTFGIIYTIVLFGFSQSFYFLYKGHPGVKTSLFSTYSSTWMALFQITLGNYDYADLGLTTYPGISKTVFALFMVFVPILLLNMLIAMMGNTYAHVIEQSEKEWMKQWAKIVISLERGIPQADAHHYLQEYSISLGPSEDPRFEQRGVMVIKSKSKTRAKQRKGAVCNWKRVGKVTVNALKKKGMTGEQMRCLMWGRESINTPIKMKGPKIDPLLDPNGPGLVGGFGGAMTTALDVMAITHDLDINSAAQGLHLVHNTTTKLPIAAVPTNQALQIQQSGVRYVPGITSDVAMFATLTQLSQGTSPAQQTLANQQMTPAVVAMTANLAPTLPSTQLLLTPYRLSLVTKPASTSNVLHGIIPTQVANVPTISATVGATVPEYGIPLSTSTPLDITDDPIRALVLHDPQMSKSTSENHKDLSRHLLTELATLAAITANAAEEVSTAQAPLITTGAVAPAAVGAKNLVGVFAGTDTLVKNVQVVKKKYTALDPSDSEGFGEITLLGRISRSRRAKSANLRRASAKQKYGDKRRLFAKSSSSSSTDTLFLATESAGTKDGAGKEGGQLDYAANRIQQVKDSLLNEVHNVDRESLRPINIDIAYGTAITISGTLNVVGDGSGVDTESVNTEKPKRKKRAKTAKSNRVSPMDYGKGRSCKSANGEKLGSESDPDPLDSWSTKGIADMNKILAWEDQQDSS